MKGRPPTPVEAKRRAGNPGKRALPEPARVSQRVLVDEDGPTDAQLRVLAAELPCPEHLAVDDEGRALWDKYAIMLGRTGWFEVSDSMALEGLVEAELAARRAWRALEAERRRQADMLERHGPDALAGEGVVVHGTAPGSIVTSPAFRVWRDARATFLRFAEQLGLSPVARTRLGVLGLAGAKLARDLDSTLPPQPVKRGRA